MNEDYYRVMYDVLTEEYTIRGPDNFSCTFYGFNRARNAMYALKVLEESCMINES